MNKMSVMSPGSMVLVRDESVGDWCTGFEVHRSDNLGVMVRRMADGILLGPLHPSMLRETNSDDVTHHRSSW